MHLKNVLLLLLSLCTVWNFSTEYTSVWDVTHRSVGSVSSTLDIWSNLWLTFASHADYIFGDGWSSMIACIKILRQHPNLPKQLKMLFSLSLRCQDIHNTHTFCVFMTKKMKIVLWPHFSNNSAVGENMHVYYCDKLFLYATFCDLLAWHKSLTLQETVAPPQHYSNILLLCLSFYGKHQSRFMGDISPISWEMSVLFHRRYQSHFMGNISPVLWEISVLFQWEISVLFHGRYQSHSTGNISPVLWEISVLFYGRYQSCSKGDISPVPWETSVLFYGRYQSCSMGNISPVLWEISVPFYGRYVPFHRKHQSCFMGDISPVPREISVPFHGKHQSCFMGDISPILWEICPIPRETSVLFHGRYQSCSKGDISPVS